jgi:hypothetical protein
MIIFGAGIALISAFQYQLNELIPGLYNEHLSRRRMIIGIPAGILYALPAFFLLRLYSRKFPKELIPPEFAPITLVNDGSAKG